MSSEMVTIVFFFAAVILYILFLWHERKSIFMFRFYASRDQLYRLAIEERISESSLAFRQLSEMLNITIAYSNKFKLKAFIQYLEEKGLENPDRNDAFFDDLSKQIPEVKDIAEAYFSNFFILLIRNHPILYILVHIRFFLDLIPGWKPEVSTALAYKNSAEKLKFAT